MKSRKSFRRHVVTSHITCYEVSYLSHLQTFQFTVSTSDTHLIDKICRHSVTHLTKSNEADCRAIGRHHTCKLRWNFQKLECHGESLRIIRWNYWTSFVISKKYFFNIYSRSLGEFEFCWISRKKLVFVLPHATTHTRRLKIICYEHFEFWNTHEIYSKLKKKSMWETNERGKRKWKCEVNRAEVW